MLFTKNVSVIIVRHYLKHLIPQVEFNSYLIHTFLVFVLAHSIYILHISYVQYCWTLTKTTYGVLIY